MTVVARERPVGAPPTRLNRVRCTHCAMPVRRSEPTCWSCGRDPACPVDPEGCVPPATDHMGRRWPGQLLLLVGGLALVVVVLLGCVTLLGSPDGTRGVRGLTARIRGEGWQRAEVSGASAEFPAPPDHRTFLTGPGFSKPAEALSAADRGVRTDLVVADMAGNGMDAPAMAEELVVAYAAAAGGRVVQRAPFAPGPAGFDALVEGAGGTVRVRVSMAGTTGYLLAVSGPNGAFERFTSSFQPAPTQPARPHGT